MLNTEKEVQDYFNSTEIVQSKILNMKKLKAFAILLFFINTGIYISITGLKDFGSLLFLLVSIIFSLELIKTYNFFKKV